MGFIPALNTVRVALEFTSNGQICVNIIFLNKSTTVFSTDFVSIASVIRSWFSTYMKGSLGNSLSLSRISMRDMTTENGDILDSVVDLPIVGTLAQEPLPNNVALACSFRTGKAGKSYRGRAYMVGFTENQIGGDHLDSTPVAALALGWSYLNTLSLVIGYTHVVASFQHNLAPRATAVLTPVTQIIVNDRLDTQRRRLPV